MISRSMPIVLAVLGCGCANADRTIMSAEVEPTSNHSVQGALTLSETSSGVMIDGEITGLDTDAVHGFHIHALGCNALGASGTASGTGGHFDPVGEVHGDPRTEHHHLGDLLSLEADAGGVAIVQQHVEGADLRLDGSHSLRDKALVVHAHLDDYVSQPDGSSGNPLACGTISEIVR